jgi:glucose-1-phosphate adenylyltransferase
MNVLAMILAGGRVDELGVLTFYRPKSAVPFGALYRIIDFPMSNLMHSGIERVGILSQYRPFRLMSHIANGEPWDMVGRNRFATILPPYKGMEAFDWYKGTADAVYQNIDFINLYNPDLVLILSGDHIYKMDYQKMIAFHLEKKADLTIAFTRMPKLGAHRFGQADIEDEDERGGKVIRYVEKPEVPLFEWASLTIYLFNPRILVEALVDNAHQETREFGKDIIPSLQGRCKVYGYKHHGYWGYTQTLEEYWQTNMELIGSNSSLDLRSWQVRTNLADRAIRDRTPARIGSRASVEDSLFYSGCTIKGTVIRSILFPGVTVEEGAVVENSIIFIDTVIGREARVTRCISDLGVIIGCGARIGEGRNDPLTVIGSSSAIPEGVVISSGTTVNPGVDHHRFTRSQYKPGEVIT